MTDFYHDIVHNVLVYRTDEPARVVKHLPEARQINGAYVAVPASLYNMQVLRWLNMPVVSAMDGYDWPCHPSIKPLPHQRAMSNFMVLHPRSFNLSDMGTMKTLATLWACDFVMQQYPKGECRALVVAPLSILDRVWGSALFKNLLGRRTFEILHGSASDRVQALGRMADFYLINFEGVGVGAHTRKRLELDGFSRGLCDRADIRICVVDEAGGYRDSGTKRHRIARQVFGAKDYLWLLTGTPTPNGPCDAYGLARLVNGAYGESYGAYQRRCMMQVSTFKWMPRAGANDMARKLLSPAVRVDIRDVWNGPPLTTQQREVELTVEQKKLLTALKRHLQIVLASGQTITPPNEAAVRHKYLQIVLGGVYDSGHASHAVDASPRLRELEQVIENTARKILVFVPLTNIVHLLYKRLKEKWSVGVVNGEVSLKERGQVIAQFANEEHPRIMLADPQTTAHGINEFVAADTAVWYGPTDKTELYLQGNKRVHRPGQQHPTTIVQLVATPLEREIFARLERNETLQGALLQMVREGKL